MAQLVAMLEDAGLVEVYYPEVGRELYRLARRRCGARRARLSLRSLPTPSSSEKIDGISAGGHALFAWSGSEPPEEDEPSIYETDARRILIYEDGSAPTTSMTIA